MPAGTRGPAGTESAPAPGAGALLAVLRDGRARTRAELGKLTGLARSTLSSRLEALLTGGLIVQAGESTSTGGRPPTTFTFNHAARVVLAADLGATHARVAVTDLAGTVLAESTADIAIALGPEQVLEWLDGELRRLLHELGRDAADVCGIGVGLPGPVEHATGRPVSPPIMPGWDGFSVPGWLGERYQVPVLVDNDVNIMALGEHWSAWPDAEHLLLVKIATGIGCGIVSAGHLHRGSQGAAGDMGHIRSTSGGDVVCRCGNVGCLEAIASGAAITRRLSDLGVPALSSRDVVRLVRSGDVEAIRLIRQAGREIGEILAATVNLFNPSVIVLGGDIAECGEQLLAGVHEVVYQRSLPLATQHLRIAQSKLGDQAGVVGAAVMVIEHVLAPETVDRAIS